MYQILLSSQSCKGSWNTSLACLQSGVDSSARMGKKIPELDTNLSFVFSILVVDSMKEALENMIDGVRIGDEL